MVRHTVVDSLSIVGDVSLHGTVKNNHIYTRYQTMDVRAFACVDVIKMMIRFRLTHAHTHTHTTLALNFLYYLHTKYIFLCRRVARVNINHRTPQKKRRCSNNPIHQHRKRRLMHWLRVLGFIRLLAPDINHGLGSPAVSLERRHIANTMKLWFTLISKGRIT
jgi:hypothetical protein